MERQTLRRREGNWLEQLKCVSINCNGLFPVKLRVGPSRKPLSRRPRSLSLLLPVKRLCTDTRKRSSYFLARCTAQTFRQIILRVVSRFPTDSSLRSDPLLTGTWPRHLAALRISNPDLRGRVECRGGSSEVLLVRCWWRRWPRPRSSWGPGQRRLRSSLLICWRWHLWWL